MLIVNCRCECSLSVRWCYFFNVCFVFPLLQFLCLKNIRTFLKVCHDKFGLRNSELFDPFDLFDVRDFGKVSWPLHVMVDLSVYKALCAWAGTASDWFYCIVTTTNIVTTWRCLCYWLYHLEQEFLLSVVRWINKTHPFPIFPLNIGNSGVCQSELVLLRFSIKSGRSLRPIRTRELWMITLWQHRVHWQFHHVTEMNMRWNIYIESLLLDFQCGCMCWLSSKGGWLTHTSS